MYEFTDTTGAPVETSRPSEALKFNGQWIEDQIPGYQTLMVKGRELMAKEITGIQVGNADGEKYLDQRIPGRTITVTYQLRTYSNQEYREAFNKLNGILSAEEAVMIFDDEPDKYFIGTARGVTEVSAGRNCVTGEIEFYCPDPAKYTVDEIVYSPSLDNGRTFSVDYKGLYRNYPTLEAHINSDCGYIGFINQDGDILQVGNPEEVDLARVDMSETLIDEDFTTATLDGWVINEAKLVTNGGGAAHHQGGEVTVDTINNRMTASNWGAGSGWHGPSITKDIPADSKGHVGAKNCTFSFRNLFASLTLYDQDLGIMEFLMTDADGDNIAAVAFYKHQAASRQGACHMHIRGEKIVATKRIPLGVNNTITGNDYGRSSIQKFGSEIIFNISGDVFSFTVPELEEVEVAQISVWLGNFGTYNTMYRNHVRAIKFVSHSVEAWQDVPNKFAAGDVVKLDCGNGDIYLNEVLTPGLGALGNEWESFFLQPKLNNINCVWSEWAEKPTFLLKFREAYL